MEVVLGVLMGLLVGMVAAARYFRQEIAASIRPMLQRIELRLENFEAEYNLDTERRREDFNEHLEHHRPRA